MMYIGCVWAFCLFISSQTGPMMLRSEFFGVSTTCCWTTCGSWLTVIMSRYKMKLIVCEISIITQGVITKISSPPLRKCLFLVIFEQRCHSDPQPNPELNSNWHDQMNLYWTSPEGCKDRVKAAYFWADTKPTQKSNVRQTHTVS